MHTEELIDANELAKILGVAPKTVRSWTSARRIPFRKFGRTVRYEPSKVLSLFVEKPKVN